MVISSDFCGWCWTRIAICWFLLYLYRFQAPNHPIFPCFRSVKKPKTALRASREVYLGRMTPAGLELNPRRGPVTKSRTVHAGLTIERTNSQYDYSKWNTDPSIKMKQPPTNSIGLSDPDRTRIESPEGTCTLVPIGLYPVGVHPALPLRGYRLRFTDCRVKTRG